MKHVLVLFALAQFFYSPAFGIEATTSVNLCDQMAASPLDPLRRRTGIKVEDININEAYTACKSAAENSGDSVSLFQLGRVYDAAKNYKMAADMYYLAAIKDHGRAWFRLGALAQDNHVTISAKPNLSWQELSASAYYQAAKSGVKESLHWLGSVGNDYYFGKRGYPLNQVLGIDILREAAGFGDRTSSLVLMDIVVDGFRGGGNGGSSPNRSFDPDRIIHDNIKRQQDRGTSD